MLKFDKNFDPNTGKAVKIAPNIRRICAPNISPFTFTGTNSYLIGDENLVIIDPGPDNKSHLSAILNAINNKKLSAILLTHTHKDHSSLAKKLSQKTSAPIYFAFKHKLSRKKKLFEINLLKNSCDWDLTPDKNLTDKQILDFGDFQIKAIATPGHCANHFCYALCDSDYLFTGDHIMGWNTSLIAPPDGSLSDYFASLDKLIKAKWNIYLPAHGAPISNAKQYAKQLKAHREYRNEQILQLLQGEYLSTGQLLDRIYPSHRGRVRFAAKLTLKAHLEYLQEKGKIASTITLSGIKYDTNV